MTFSFIKRRCNDFLYKQISCRFNPRNLWLINKIPRTWVDKDTIIEICLLECIKHYVEGEGALEYFEDGQKDPEYPEHQKIRDRQIKENYELATKKLPKLESQLQKEWEKIMFLKPGEDLLKYLNDTSKSYEEKYGEINRLEKEIHDLKTKVMVWVVENREYLWT